MENFSLAVILSLMSYVFLHMSGLGGKMIISIFFGIVSYLIMSAMIDNNRDLIVNYGPGLGEQIAWHELPQTAIQLATQTATQNISNVAQRQLRFGTLYDQEIGFDVSAIENKYMINDVIQPTLTFVRGNIYKFRIPNGIYGEFPFYFSISNEFGGAYQDPEFILGLGRHQDVDFIDITLSVTSKTPDVIYYHSGTQKNMGGRIDVINEKLSIYEGV